MQVSVDPDDVIERTTDSRGRFTLGSEYANQRVEVAVLEHCEQIGPGIIVKEYLKAVQSDEEPCTYRWFVTEFVYNHLYDKLCLNGNIDGYDARAEFGPKGMQFRITGDRVDLRPVDVPATLETAGEVVARKFDDLAILVRYPGGADPEAEANPPSRSSSGGRPPPDR